MCAESNNLRGRVPVAYWPKATLVRTGNADSNAPMLAINTRLGFTQAWADTIWEVGIADARRYVGGE